MGLRPTKGDEDAECINSWQAKAPAPRRFVQVGQALSPANSAGKDWRLKPSVPTGFVVALPCGRGSVAPHNYSSRMCSFKMQRSITTASPASRAFCAPS
jgi:hypothetical protein